MIIHERIHFFHVGSAFMFWTTFTCSSSVEDTIIIKKKKKRPRPTFIDLISERRETLIRISQINVKLKCTNV